jgi:hypothetical protein
MFTDFSPAAGVGSVASPGAGAFGAHADNIVLRASSSARQIINDLLFMNLYPPYFFLYKKASIGIFQ